MACCPIQGLYLLHIECFYDGLQIHHGPEQDKVLTEDE